MGFLKDAIAAYEANRPAAEQAFAIYREYCNGHEPHAVPGMPTIVRLAHRISIGRSPEEAAAREYSYRWHLAIKAPDQCNATGKRSYDLRDSDPRACISIFGAPHAIGL